MNNKICTNYQRKMIIPLQQQIKQFHIYYMDKFVLHRIGWVIHVYYLNFVEEKIWRNNFKMGGWEVVEDEKSFSHPGQHFAKTCKSDTENYV